MEVTATEPSAPGSAIYLDVGPSQQFGFDLCWQRQGYTGCHPAIRSTPAEKSGKRHILVAAPAFRQCLHFKGSTVIQRFFQPQPGSGIAGQHNLGVFHPFHRVECIAGQGLGGNQACHRERVNAPRSAITRFTAKRSRPVLNVRLAGWRISAAAAGNCARLRFWAARFGTIPPASVRPNCEVSSRGRKASACSGCCIQHSLQKESPAGPAGHILQKGGRDWLVSWHQAGSKCLRSASTARCCNTAVHSPSAA